MRKKNADQVSGGVFLIGLATLFMTGFWWPGILFVIAASIFAKSWMVGKPISTGALFMLLIATMFAIPGLFNGFNWGLLIPIVLIFAGLSKLSNGFGFNSSRLDDEEFDVFVRGKPHPLEEEYDDDYYYDDLDDPYYQEKRKNG